MPKNDKLSIAAMKAAATTLGLSLPEGDPIAAAKVLQKHYTENYESDKLALCGHCEYAAHEDLTSCPFCGTDLGGSEPEVPVVKKVKQPKVKVAKKAGAKKEKEPKEEVAIEPPDPKLVEEVTSRVEKIKSLRENLVRNSYQIGKELKEINEKQLFKAMGHKSFVEFCKERLEYSRVMAYKYMSLTNFTEEDAILLGPTKADLVANAGTAENGELSKKQKKLLEMVRKGASRSDLEKELNKGKAKPERDTDTITMVGRVREKELFVPWLSDTTGKPTKKDTIKKHGEVEIVSGFVITVVEREKGDGLVFKFSKVGEVADPEAAENEAAKDSAEE